MDVKLKWVTYAAFKSTTQTFTVYSSICLDQIKSKRFVVACKTPSIGLEA